MRKVLLVEDDPLFRSLVARHLKERGWEVITAADGEDGLKLARQHKLAAVICDLRMPRCNGFQFCRTLRSEEGPLRPTRIVVATASAYATDRQNALEAGADDYVVKPVLPSQLSDLLEDVARATPAEAAEALAPAVPAGARTRLKFWGVRGSIAAPGPATVRYGGNTSCVEVRSNGELIVLDAGTGIRPLGLALRQEFAEQALCLTILISHTHWDHIQGIPFFVPAYDARNRIRILGYEGARRGLELTLAAQMESPYFPVSMGQMPGNITIEEIRDLTFHVGAVRVEATFLNHPGICAGYRLITPGGSIAYLPDFEPYRHPPAGEAGAAEATAASDYARAQEDRLVEFIRGSEVLIADAQYDDEEYKCHPGWGHSSASDSVSLAVKAQVKQMFLFHHDPTHDDQKITHMVQELRQYAARLGSPLRLEAAREGLEVELAAEPAG